MENGFFLDIDFYNIIDCRFMVLVIYGALLIQIDSSEFDRFGSAHTYNFSFPEIRF